MTGNRIDRSWVRTPRVLGLAVLSVTLAAPAAFAAELAFSLAEGRAPAAPSSYQGAVAAAAIVPNAAAVTAGAASLGLPTPSGAVVVAERSSFEDRGDGDGAWRGTVGDGGRATLTVKDGLLAGRFEDGGRLYEVVAHPSSPVVVELDADAFPDCGGAVEATDLDGTPGRAPASAAGGTSVLDVISFYTPQARDAAGGVAAIEATIQAAVDNANTAFLDSLVPAEMNLVHTELAAYDDTGNLSGDLAWVRNDVTIAGLRDAFGADLVSLIVDNGGSGCGIGYVMRNVSPTFAPSAYQVTDRGCAVGNLTYAHEHGHNLGLEHDPANGTLPGLASFPWSFGHFIDGSYRTVMSYSTECTLGCTRVAHFSNPDVDHNGVPTGIADERDNARTLVVSTPVGAAFRDPPVGCTDGDSDGYGFPGSALCTFPETDCDDTDPAVNPGATEIPGNGIDDDCNATTPGACQQQLANAAPLAGGAAPIGLPLDVALFAIPAAAAITALRRRRRMA